ncbi:MAG TPA: hypothetical protein PK257_00915 [Candidatus Woesebacteria bacterium]|nr:hypothetical protein [Candidatus Woesebacteria bacterium]
MTESEGSNYTKEDLRSLHLNDDEIVEINRHPLGDGEKDDDVLVIDSEGKKIYRPEDAGAIYKIKQEKDTLLDLRKRQFWIIQYIKKEMEEKGDDRHLFLIGKGWSIESQKGFNGRDFFRGFLENDVLAEKEKNGLKLIPFDKSSEIKISYTNPYDGETRFRKIPHFNARNEVPKLDLMDPKINSPEELNKRIMLINKK